MKQENLSHSLLNWYHAHGRELPWRIKGGAHLDPYVILVSEFMLQQTGVKTVIPYFERFMKRFPTVQTLATATQEEVYHYWQGLGYYTRARSLHSSAQIIVSQFGGIFPQTKAEALKLKGVGDYTAASFLALAFNKPATVIDGNVIRVICRLFHLTEPIDKIMDIIRQKAELLSSQEHPADYASAIMDLGALICTPKNPQCLLCPWQQHCQSKNSPELESIPQRKKLAKKIKHGSVYLVYNGTNQVFITKRGGKKLLSGLYEFPWCEEGELLGELHPQDSGKQICHVFTHFKLTLKIFIAKAESLGISGEFVAIDKLPNYPISTLMKKVIACELAQYPQYARANGQQRA